MQVDTTDDGEHSLSMQLGAAIRQARGKTTQTKLAALIGGDQGTVSRWEKGKQRPSLEDIAAIERVAKRPRGYVLVQAGLVDLPVTLEEAIRMTTELTDEGKSLVLLAYRGARQQQAPTDGQ